MRDYQLLRHELQKELDGGDAALDEREFGTAALCFGSAAAYARRLARRLGREGRDNEGRAA